MSPLSYGGVTTVIGLFIVFFGMSILIGLLTLMSVIFKSIDKKKNAAKAAALEVPVAKPIPAPVVEEEETEEVDDSELIAVIAAAIAAFDGGDKPLVVKSVRRVSGWRNAARSEQVYKF